MNYQQAIADATNQILCQTAAVAATTADAATGSGFLSCLAAAAATMDSAFPTADVAADAREATTTADVATGSGFSFCSAAVDAATSSAAMATDADAANVPAL